MGENVSSRAQSLKRSPDRQDQQVSQHSIELLLQRRFSDQWHGPQQNKRSRELRGQIVVTVGKDQVLPLPEASCLTGTHQTFAPSLFSGHPTRYGRKSPQNP